MMMFKFLNYNEVFSYEIRSTFSPCLLVTPCQAAQPTPFTIHLTCQSLIYPFSGLPPRQTISQLILVIKSHVLAAKKGFAKRPEQPNGLRVQGCGQACPGRGCLVYTHAVDSYFINYCRFSFLAKSKHKVVKA